ncbi:MAG TPA: enoyl-CoA hydratase/isomerase family protein [Vicinamibacterales bacterium]|nr:enoyl-CoA hydratase/isomerase family protein [Vicinamibacterales bacterium]
MIIREDSGSIAVLRLAHGKVNALDVDFCHALVRELEHVAASDARALVVTGTGSAFSAGVDLFQVLDGGAAYLKQFLPAMEAFFRTLLAFPKPAIAAVNGHAIAGGCIIAAACDYRVMAGGGARIGVPELAVGVPFPTLPFEIVRARVSPAHFRELVFTGRTLPPQEAVAVGLIDEIAPMDVLLTRAEHAAERLADIPPVTFRLTKRTFTEPLLERVRHAASLNADVLEAWESPAVQSRMRAYVEKTVGRK